MKPRNLVRTVLIAAGCVIIGLVVSILLLNQQATRWVDGDSFRTMLDHETSKGLKFEGHYSPLVRTGAFSMRADSFDGIKGYKTIVSIHADDISGRFNPLGVILKRWQLEDVHLRSGVVMLQKTEATPGASKGPTPMPWWGLFWPYRVYLADVKVDDAKILWQLQEKESGIYDTFLEITPNGRDFEYDARGGIFSTPISPPLKVRHVHLLIRKPRLYCSEFLLGDDATHPEQQLEVKGDAGLQDDRSITLKMDFTSMNVSPWMPVAQRTHIRGHASGHFEYTSSSTSLETAKGQGNIAIADGVLHELAAVRQYAKVTGSPDPGDMALKTCQADVRWEQGALTVENIKVESVGIFRLEGTVTIGKDKSLSGTLDLGLTDPYLKWLPTAREAIFTREDESYHFAAIHLSGTVQKPDQDLSKRLTKEVEKSPLVAIKLFFNQASTWF